ncbi:alpha/beta hydrolase [Parasphingorhabdus sp.]|uniref:alpha/beta hydrolase n=1 Tax=Parasphingorhabdus sp. TaxID=2709688 RepID=UPI003A9053F6
MAEELKLADGISEYIAAFRSTNAGGTVSMNGGRLRSDLNAAALAYPCPDGMMICNSFVPREGGETAVRIYRPAPARQSGAAIVYFHGGGFTLGSIETFEPLAMALAEASGAAVISVQYSRLPQATPHMMMEESYTALCWVAEMAELLSIDPARLAVAGDSAGAFIATLLAVMARDRNGPKIACQILCYGVFDIDETRQYYNIARDPVLVRPVIEAMVKTYRSCNARAPFSYPPPLHIDDLSALPPALLVEAEHDSMLEEGLQYAGRLRDAGNEVSVQTVSGMIHGFFRAVRFSQPARDEMKRLGASLQPYLQP